MLKNISSAVLRLMPGFGYAQPPEVCPAAVLISGG